MSWEGYCGVCGPKVMWANAEGIHFKTGPAYDRWRYGIVKQALGNRVALALKQAGVING